MPTATQQFVIRKREFDIQQHVSGIPGRVVTVGMTFEDLPSQDYGTLDGIIEGWVGGNNFAVDDFGTGEFGPGADHEFIVDIGEFDPAFGEQFDVLFEEVDSTFPLQRVVLTY